MTVFLLFHRDARDYYDHPVTCCGVYSTRDKAVAAKDAITSAPKGLQGGWDGEDRFADLYFWVAEVTLDKVPADV